MVAGGDRPLPEWASKGKKNTARAHMAPRGVRIVIGISRGFSAIPYSNSIHDSADVTAGTTITLYMLRPYGIPSSWL